jgi:copper(I)-binding protein
VKRRAAILALAILPGLTVPVLAQDFRAGHITVSHPWARASIGKAKNGVAYMTISSHGQAVDRLVKVSSPIARKAALHTHIMEGGIMKMRPVGAIEVDPGTPTVLKPGGLHVMLMGLNAPLKQGETLPLTLSFEKAGSVDVAAEVHGPGAMGPGHDQMKHDAQHNHQAGSAGAPTCDTAVRVTEAAERKLGGALYTGPMVKQHGDHGRSMPSMEGAHMVHQPQHGGAFFMAPDKIHHLEGLYTDDCGFVLFFYNAFTEEIRADRFQALIKVLPKNDDEPEVMRFLSPSPDGNVLRGNIGNEVSRPFDIELYVKFPEADDPQLFNIRVPEPQQ